MRTLLLVAVLALMSGSVYAATAQPDTNPAPGSAGPDTRATDASALSYCGAWGPGDHYCRTGRVLPNVRNGRAQ